MDKRLDELHTNCYLRVSGIVNENKIQTPTEIILDPIFKCYLETNQQPEDITRLWNDLGNYLPRSLIGKVLDCVREEILQTCPDLFKY